MYSFESLLADGEIVKIETTRKANTALRVGTLFQKIITQMKAFVSPNPATVSGLNPTLNFGEFELKNNYFVSKNLNITGASTDATIVIADEYFGDGQILQVLVNNTTSNPIDLELSSPDGFFYSKRLSTLVDRVDDTLTLEPNTVYLLIFNRQFPTWFLAIDSFE